MKLKQGTEIPCPECGEILQVQVDYHEGGGKYAPYACYCGHTFKEEEEDENEN